jgi:hypothetical protein
MACGPFFLTHLCHPDAPSPRWNPGREPQFECEQSAPVSLADIAFVVTIGRDVDLTDWQTHRLYDAIDDCLLSKDATVGIQSESMSLQVEDHPPAWKFFVLHVQRRNSQPVEVPSSNQCGSSCA